MGGRQWVGKVRLRVGRGWARRGRGMHDGCTTGRVWMRNRGEKIAMGNRLFGECLGRVVPLSGLDVAEILEDQETSGRRFGEIALAWGLCQPEHVWVAWAAQLGQQTQVVDLSRVGIDAQAVAMVPARLARRMRAVPVRTAGEDLVVAAEEATLERAAKRLPRLLGRKVRFVVAPADQIQSALTAYYPPAADEPRRSD